MNETVPNHRSTFDVFKSAICHQVKEQGDIDFIIHILESGMIFQYKEKGWYTECLYLLAMVDYLSRENDLPLCSDFSDLRKLKLEKPLYPLSVKIADAVTGDTSWSEASIEEAIPEFKRFNIIESDIRNVI